MNLSEGLVKLLPAKFRSVERLADFIVVCGQLLDEIHAKMDGLKDFRDPDEIPEQYIHFLGNLFGYEIFRTYRVGSLGETGRRREVLRSVVDLIKQKGLKVGPSNILYFFYQFSELEIYELWTQDYVTFSTRLPSDPTGFYLSPHYLVRFPTDIYTRLGQGDVWAGKKVVNHLLERIRENQPAHTVLHVELGVPQDVWRIGPADWDIETTTYEPFYGFRWRVGGSGYPKVDEAEQIRVGGEMWD